MENVAYMPKEASAVYVLDVWSMYVCTGAGLHIPVAALSDDTASHMEWNISLASQRPCRIKDSMPGTLLVCFLVSITRERVLLATAKPAKRFSIRLTVQAAVQYVNIAASTHQQHTQHPIASPIYNMV